MNYKIFYLIKNYFFISEHLLYLQKHIIMATMKKRGPKPKKPGEKKVVINVWVKEKHTKEARRQADKLEALYG